MRFLGVLGVLCFMVTPAMAAIQSYHMPIEDTSSLSLELTIGGADGSGYEFITDTGIGTSGMAGIAKVEIDEATSEAEMVSIHAELIDDLVITVDLTPFDMYIGAVPGATTFGWVQLSTVGLDPLTLDSPSDYSSGGPAVYDGSGNITFPDVQMSVGGQAYLTCDDTRGENGETTSFLSALIGFALLGEMNGIPDGGVLVDLSAGMLAIDLTEDLTGVLDLDGTPAGTPTIEIPFDFVGIEEIPPLALGFGVSGDINLIPEPVSVSLLALGGMGMLLRRRR